MDNILTKYGQLIVNYCLDTQAGDKILVKSTTLAEPLVREIYRAGLEVGATVDCILSFREQNRILHKHGSNDALSYISPTYERAIQHFDGYVNIIAPFNLSEDSDLPAQKQQVRKTALQPISEVYSQRTATRSLKRNLCLYPTLANAQQAGMSLEAYQQFVFEACYLHTNDPKAKWLEVRKQQQQIVDYLNGVKTVRYINDQTDITFSTNGRTWINSDGQTNMPSGEVYTSPVEDSVQGHIHFTFPSIYGGQLIEGVSLFVENGEITKWTAKRGQSFLDHVFKIPGARRFGEVAIGTNYNISTHTNNILFDEKIGGTVHMAIGQSYLQTGGKNHSSIHWDMITDMTHNGGEIWTDGDCIYKNGYFTIF